MVEVEEIMPSAKSMHFVLKNLFAEAETKSVTFLFQFFRQLWGSTVENSHLPFVLVQYLLEDFIPIRTAGIGPRFQSSQQISILLYEMNRKTLSFLFLFYFKIDLTNICIKKVKGHLKSDRFHIGF